MAKFHINGKGEPGQCRATKSCPFGGDAQHYDSPEKAQQAFELSMAAETLAPGHRSQVQPELPFPEPHRSEGFAPGAKVQSKEFGRGTVAKKSVRDETLKVDFENHGSLYMRPDELEFATPAPTRGFAAVGSEYNLRLRSYSLTGLKTEEGEVLRLCPPSERSARLEAISAVRKAYYPQVYGGFEKKDLAFDEEERKDELRSRLLGRVGEQDEERVQAMVNRERTAWEVKARTAPARSYEKSVPIRLLPAGTEVRNPSAPPGRNPHTKVGVPVLSENYEEPHAKPTVEVVGKYQDGTGAWDYVTPDTTFDLGFCPSAKPLSPRWKEVNGKAEELARQRARYNADLAEGKLG